MDTVNTMKFRFFNLPKPKTKRLIICTLQCSYGGGWGNHGTSKLLIDSNVSEFIVNCHFLDDSYLDFSEKPSILDCNRYAFKVIYENEFSSRKEEYVLSKGQNYERTNN